MSARSDKLAAYLASDLDKSRMQYVLNRHAWIVLRDSSRKDALSSIAPHQIARLNRIAKQFIGTPRYKTIWAKTEQQNMDWAKRYEKLSKHPPDNWYSYGKMASLFRKWALIARERRTAESGK